MKDKRSVKVISLVALTFQNAVLSLSMRYVETQYGDKFVSATAVVMSEVVKCIISLFLVYYYESFSLVHFVKTLHGTVVKQPIDTLKVSVPAITYIVQNNLLYISASHLDAATNQVTYQLKILTTALFAVCILRRSLGFHQWVALVLLLSGVALVQLSDVKDHSAATTFAQNRMVGLSAVLAACFLSGFAGIYFEKILKGSDISIWMRNVQLSVIAIPAGLIHAYTNSWDKLSTNGFFHGYNYFVIYVILLQAVGGLIVAVVVKYADNILKGFATSLAIILSCIFSIYLFDFSINYSFVIGTIFVIFSVFLYSNATLVPHKTFQNQAVEKA